MFWILLVNPPCSTVTQPAEDPEGVENLFAYQKGVQIEISLENGISEIEKRMGMEGFYCPPLLKPSEGVFPTPILCSASCPWAPHLALDKQVQMLHNVRAMTECSWGD